MSENSVSTLVNNNN